MHIILIAAISADGKIAEQAGQSSLDWTSKEDLKFFVAKTKEIGTVVMGRKTYDTIGKPLKGRRNIVMTKTAISPEFIEGDTRLEYTSETPSELIARLDREGVHAIAVCGGATIYSQFLAAGLVDELYLTVEPVLFGNGVPLLIDGGRIDLDFLDMQKMGEQAVLLHYRCRN